MVAMLWYCLGSYCYWLISFSHPHPTQTIILVFLCRFPFLILPCPSLITFVSFLSFPASPRPHLPPLSFHRPLSIIPLFPSSTSSYFPPYAFHLISSKFTLSRPNHSFTFPPLILFQLCHLLISSRPKSSSFPSHHIPTISFPCPPVPIILHSPSSHSNHPLSYLIPSQA